MVPRFGTSFGGQAANTFGPRTWIFQKHRFYGRSHKTDPDRDTFSGACMTRNPAVSAFVQVSPTTAKLRAYESYKGRRSSWLRAFDHHQVDDEQSWRFARALRRGALWYRSEGLWPDRQKPIRLDPDHPSVIFRVRMVALCRGLPTTTRWTRWRPRARATK